MHVYLMQSQNDGNSFVPAYKNIQGYGNGQSRLALFPVNSPRKVEE